MGSEMCIRDSITAGADVTLTCTVVLAELEGVSSLSATTVWTGPSGMLTGSAAAMMGTSPPTYTSTLILASISSDQGGSYSCQALVNSTSSFLMASGMVTGTIIITVGRMSLIAVPHIVSYTTTVYYVFISSFVYTLHV